MKEIVLGNGTVLLQTIEQEGRRGIILRPNQEKNEIDATLPNDDPRNNDFIPGEFDVIIWCDNLLACRVLQDKVNTLALRLNGYDEKLNNAEVK